MNRADDDAGGINYGWDVMEGDRCFTPPCGLDQTQDFHPPIAVYEHDLGCSVSGGYVYRGDRFPQLRGTYFFGDYCSGRIWSLDADGDPEQEPRELLDTGLSVSSFGEDEKGELYVIDLGGAVHRLRAK